MNRVSFGISTNYLSDIERGKSSLRLDKLVLIINALDCSADDIFADVIKNGYKVKASHLSELIDNLPKEKQNTAIEILNVLAKN